MHEQQHYYRGLFTLHKMPLNSWRNSIILAVVQSVTYPCKMEKLFVTSFVKETKRNYSPPLLHVVIHVICTDARTHNIVSYMCLHYTAISLNYSFKLIAEYYHKCLDVVQYVSFKCKTEKLIIASFVEKQREAIHYPFYL